MFDIGRVCTKIAGKDAGKIVVIVNRINEHMVLIDGDVKRKQCNLLHLEPHERILELKENASTEEVKKALASGITKEPKKVSKPKKEKVAKTKETAKPTKQRATKEPKEIKKGKK